MGLGNRLDRQTGKIVTGRGSPPGPHWDHLGASANTDTGSQAQRLWLPRWSLGMGTVKRCTQRVGRTLFLGVSLRVLPEDLGRTKTQREREKGIRSLSGSRDIHSLLPWHQNSRSLGLWTLRLTRCCPGVQAEWHLTWVTQGCPGFPAWSRPLPALGAPIPTWANSHNTPWFTFVQPADSVLGEPRPMQLAVF